MPQKPRKRDLTNPPGQQAGLGYVPTRVSRDGDGGGDIIISGPPGNVSITLNPSVLARMGAGIGLGQDGDAGDPGPPGVRGETGLTGATGAQGPQGFGIDGIDGEDGIAIPGVQGPPGNPGATGPTGAPGFYALGLDGADGEEGPMGMPSPLAPPTASCVLITEVITASSQASVTFSSIATIYRDLEVVVRGRGTQSVTEIDIDLQFNGDTGNNYDEQTSYLYNSTFNAVSHGVGRIKGPNIAGASATSGVPGFIRMKIGDYRGTVFFKAVFCHGYWRPGTGAGDGTSFVGGGLWRSTAAINAVKVFPSAGNFVDGTVVSLYGIM